ncbi:MAG: substrate-binding domain-containing protein, partial [Gaiellales bacterium]
VRHQLGFAVMRGLLVLTACLALGVFAGTAAGSTTPSGAGSDVPAAAFQVLCDQSALCSYHTGRPTPDTKWVGVTGIGGAVIARQLGGKATFIPTAIGSIAVVANLPGKQGSAIRLRGAVLAQIMAGRIKRWNARAIRLTNSSLQMPQQTITLCATKGATGINLITSHYLTRVSRDFAATVGTSASPAWRAPKMVYVSSITDIGSCLTKHAGSIGFMPFGDALRQSLSDNAISLGWSKPGTAYFQGGVTKPTTVDEFTGPNDVSAQKSVSTIGSANALPDTIASKRAGSYPLTVLVGIAARAPFTPAVAKVASYFLSPAAQAWLPSLGYAPLQKQVLAAVKARIAASS